MKTGQCYLLTVSVSAVCSCVFSVPSPAITKVAAEIGATEEEVESVLFCFFTAVRSFSPVFVCVSCFVPFSFFSVCFGFFLWVLPVRGLLCFCSSSLYYLCSCVLWCSQCYFLSSGLFPFLVLCPIFSVQDGDNGGKSTKCCWLMDQNFPWFGFSPSLPPIMWFPVSSFSFPWVFSPSFPWLFFCLFPSPAFFVFSGFIATEFHRYQVINRLLFQE